LKTFENLQKPLKTFWIENEIAINDSAEITKAIRHEEEEALDPNAGSSFLLNFFFGSKAYST